jgi:hypothetical protein
MIDIWASKSLVPTTEANFDISGGGGGYSVILVGKFKDMFLILKQALFESSKGQTRPLELVKLLRHV